MSEAMKHEERGSVYLILLCVIGGLFFAVLVLALVVGSIINGSVGAPDGSAPSITAADTEVASNEQPSTGADLDSGGAQLVCVRLPGVNYPKTPALDRRVARRLIAALRELEAAGVRNLTFTFGFRTKCQQINVNPGTNLKAKPGTSPHEAGRAVDMNGMRVRADRGTIIRIMAQHGFVWLAHKDPPHFHVQPATIGEVSNGAMINKMRELWQRGQPVEGCRGTECGL